MNFWENEKQNEKRAFAYSKLSRSDSFYAEQDKRDANWKICAKKARVIGLLFRCTPFLIALVLILRQGGKPTSAFMYFKAQLLLDL
jgi:hypothetical protein